MSLPNERTPVPDTRSLSTIKITSQFLLAIKTLLSLHFSH